MKALSLWQPWATLVALGAKTIETRSWSTPYRGSLAIHAAKTLKGFDTLRGDCEGTAEGGWRYGYIGDYQAGYCYQTSDEGTRGDTFLVNCEHGVGIEHDGPIPMGAIVAVCDLVDVVPMDRWDARRSDLIGDYPHTGPLPHQLGGLWLTGPRVGVPTRIEDQREYGDFTPGRFGWVLENIEALPEPIPVAGHQGLWEWDATGALMEALNG